MMTPPRKESLLEAILREETLLADLDMGRERAQARLQRLKAEFASLDTEPSLRAPLPFSPTAQVPRTSTEKVALFRMLFRGRSEIFPTRFTSKSGKHGYAPACSNKWVRGVCGLPKVKCAECPNQAFIPVSDQAIFDHLQGRHVMGLYPMLEDETCWLLAADFDKSTWADDMAAFAETCRDVGIPVARERSRSGNGAHAWFFFTAPVAASVARKMGCYLMTETMARRHQLSMESYDRLFPSQDTMPRGGFGNLIALPLQYRPRQHGNTVFLNEQLVPYQEQWAYLASVARIDPATVELIAREASRQGQVVGVRLTETGKDEESAAPWTSLPSGKSRTRLTEPLPRKIHAVLAQRLFVQKLGVPSALLNQIKRLAAFQNPEFYKKQGMRLSTATTPRVIACAEELAQHIALPRGCRAELEELLREHQVSLVVEDQRHDGEPVELHFQGQLTPLQERAVRALLGDDIGVFVAPPGVGKTVVGVYLVAERACSTLVLVHRRPLLDQWMTQLSIFLGVESKAIGQIGGGKRKPTGRVDVAMIQSLIRKGKVDDLVAGYGHVIVDECHHVPAISVERVLNEAKARYITGLTATPRRRDGHDPITQMQLGPVRFSVDPKSQAAHHPFVHRLIVRETSFKAPSVDSNAGIQRLYAALAADESRNELILNDVIRALEDGRSPILLTERKDHLGYFAAHLCKFTRHLVVLQGGMTRKDRREAVEQLAAIRPKEERLVLATGRYVGEGFDDARLDTLFLAMPVSWKGTLVQYTGRLHRLHPGKTEVRIFDYVDREIPMLLRMFEKRLRGYRAIGYARGEAPLGYEEVNEPVIELDEEVLHSLHSFNEFA